MAENVELARAYLTLVPSFQGAQGAIMEGLVPAASSGGQAAATGFAGSFKKFAAPLLTGAALVGTFKGLYSVGEIFDDVADTIQIGTGASGDALDGLVESAKNVGRTVPAEFASIAPVIADLNTRLGLTGPTLETVAAQFLEAGRILGQDVDINQATAAFNLFKLEGEDVAAGMDTLFQVSQATGLGMNDLTGLLQSSGAALQTLGFGWADSAALLGSFDKAGLNTQQVMAAMSKGIVTLAKDGEQPVEAFQRVISEIEGFIEVGDTAAALDLASQLFGTRGAVQFMEAIKNGTFAAEDLMGAIGATGDTILGVGSDTADFAEKWQMVKNNALLAMEPLGRAVFDALSDALSALMPYLQNFGAWLGENQWVLGVVAGIIGVTLVGAFISWTGSIWASTAALLASPITWVVLGIGALIAGLTLLIQNWDAVVEWLQTVWAGVVDFLAGIWTSITEGITTAWNAIRDFFTGIWENITGAIETAWNGIRDFFTGLWDTITGGISTAWQGIIDFFANTWENIRTTLENVWNGIIDWFGRIPGWLLDALGNAGSWLVQKGRDFIDGLWNGLKNVWNSVAGWFGSIPDAIRGFFAGAISWLFGLGSNVIDGLWNGIKNIWTNTVNWFLNIPNAIKGFFSNAGSWLFEAGKAILNGLWDGLKSIWTGITNFFSGIGSWIKEHKGPLDYDKQLLVPAGKAIMGGFDQALQEGWAKTQRTVKGINADITGMSLAASMGAVPVTGGNTLIYQAAPNASLSAEEELFEAAGRARMVGWAA